MAVEEAAKPQGSPGFPSGTSTSSSSSGSSSSSDVNYVAGYGSAGMGVLQMAVGMSQLRRANRLPFPGYLATKGPYAEMATLYDRNIRMGVGSEQRGIMQTQNDIRMAQQLNAIAQGSPQASAAFGRTAALNRTGGTMQVAQADFAARQAGMSGKERMNAAMSLILQKDIKAARDYRIDAEQAAGAAIARGSTNIAESLANMQTKDSSSSKEA
jgi:hypothetical protein